jgi:hypothetical protein
MEIKRPRCADLRNWKSSSRRKPLLGFPGGGNQQQPDISQEKDLISNQYLSVQGKIISRGKYSFAK